jgi:asparagine synthase (glutamine-hydrolysing)
MTKHFCQWGAEAVGDVTAKLRTRLGEEIDAVGLPASPEGDHGIYEWCEFQDRQSKYVVGGQRVYEHLGLDWRLPLWDQRYLSFWERAPLAAKAHQRLYRDMLTRANWGGVWRDIPVNRKTIKPAWMIPLRYAAKLAHAPLGKKRWHAFERRYLQYWMSNLCNYALVPYGQVTRDGRGHRSGISWHIEIYLSKKGLGLDGRPLASKTGRAE